MSKIYDITERLEGKKRQEELDFHRDKMEALQRIVRCSSCHMKCAMCGLHLEPPDEEEEEELYWTEFSLCEGCSAEFEDYLAQEDGGEPPGRLFWHNREWKDLWAAWMEFQRALKAFRNSKELETIRDGCDC